MPTIPYVAQTWTDGTTDATAARLLTLENGIKEVSLAPAVRAYHNAPQNVLTATATALTLNSERFDQVAGSASTMHDNVTNNSRLTCRYAGIYQISGTAEIAANATGYRMLSILHQGTTYIQHTTESVNTTTNATRIGVSTLYALAVNEYVELVVFQNSGVTLTVASVSAFSPEFMMVRVA